jgi:hypothetical protein
MIPEPIPHNAFPKSWTARILTAPPLISPARQFVYPLYVPGEEDAMARGALLLDIKPANAPNFLATCALGYRDPNLPSAIYPCPRPDDLLALAGGYAYLIDTQNPRSCLHLPLRPVTQILSAPEAGLILLAGFHHVDAIGPTGLLWQSARLSWEGITLTAVRNNELHGLGWNMHTDKEVPFTVDLASGQHVGGGYQA